MKEKTPQTGIDSGGEPGEKKKSSKGLEKKYIHERS